MNKKANLDSPTAVIQIFVMGVAIIIVGLIIAVGITAFGSNVNALNLLTNAQTMFFRMGNSGFIFMALALIIFNMIGAFFLPTHPIFVVIDLIFIPISVWITAIVSNAWESTMAPMATAQGFVIMNYIFSNLVIIILAADILTAIVSYAIIKNGYA